MLLTYTGYLSALQIGEIHICKMMLSIDPRNAVN